MTTRRIILLGLLVLHTLPNATTAQGIPHFVEKLTIDEGLSSNIITGLVQDDNGFLWIATPDGLNRLDGTEIIHYMHLQDKSSLPHSYVNCLLKLPGNDLAIGTQAGLSFYNTTTGAFQNFYSHHQPALDLYNNTIMQLVTDARGNCWAASRGCIYIFTPQHQLKKIIPAPFNEATAAKERLSFVEKMLPLSTGDVLLCLNNGWALYSATADSLIHYQLPPPFLPSNNPAGFPGARLFTVFGKHLFSIPPGKDSLLLLDEKGHQESSCYFPYNKYPFISWSQQLVTLDSSRLLLLLHNYGLLIIPLHWQNGTPLLSTLSPLLFDRDEYQTALLDKQGNWWLATTKEGLQKISPSRQYFTGTSLIDRQTKHPIRYEVMSCNRVGQTLWVCTYGDGFFEIDLPTGRQIQHRLTGTGDDTWANFVWNTSRQNKDTLFLGTQTGLFWYSTTTGKNGRLTGWPGKPPVLDSVAITTQFLDSHGLLWMGLGKGKGVCVYDQDHRRFTWYPGNSANGYPLRYPTDIAEDIDGNCWFTSDASDLLVCWQRQTGQFLTIKLPPAPQRQVGPFRGICSQSDSILWIGDVTGGLVKFNRRTHHTTLYGRENGLSNCHISDIHEDQQKRLWLVTEGGLVCFDPYSESFTNFTAKDGLPTAYPTANLFYDPRDKRLYSGGHGNFFYFDPHDIFPTPVTKKPLITAIQVNGVSWHGDPSQPIVFHSQQNDISIQYTAVDLTDGPSTHYLYRLIGADTGWMMAGKQRQINFSRLPPGSYTFQVRTVGPNDIGDAAITAISFRIDPPFTQTTGFYALITGIVASVVYILYRLRKRQINRTRQIRTEISRNLHDEVGANLTNISLSSLLARREIHNEKEVGRILERIYQDSQMVSESMREIVWSINPDIDTLGDALPRMLHYAANLLEANSIEFQADILPEVERVRLSMKQRRDVYLIFKEAMNNMARHSKATKAIVQFYLSGKALIMKITDNGAGFEPRLTNLSNGLRNMKERARQHHWKLEISSLPQQGTTIILNTA